MLSKARCSHADNSLGKVGTWVCAGVCQIRCDNMQRTKRRTVAGENDSPVSRSEQGASFLLRPKLQKQTFGSASAHRHDEQTRERVFSFSSRPNAPAAFFHLAVPPSGTLQEPSRNTFSLPFSLCFDQSAARSYLCKGAACKVSGKRTLHHQSRRGHFIGIALHVCMSDFDPVCVSLGLFTSVCISLREGAHWTCGGGVGVVFRVEKPRQGPGCTLLYLLQSSNVLKPSNPDCF